MKKKCIKKVNLTKSRSFTIPEELADHTILALGVVSGVPVLRLLTEEEFDRLPANTLIQRTVCCSALWIEDGCCEIPVYFREYAGISDSCELIVDEAGRCYICSEENAQRLL